MCDPLSITGALLTAGSMAAKYAASKQASAAQKRVLEEEAAAQSAYDDRASAINQQSQDRYANIDETQDTKKSELSDYFTKHSGQIADSSDANTAASKLQSSSKNLLNRETSKQLASANAYGDQQNSALASMRSFGDTLADINREQGQDAALLGEIGGFKQGLSSILPYKLEDAANKGSGLSLFGDVLGVAGMATGLGGMAGLGTGASGAGIGGTTAQNLFGSESGSFGRWLAGNAGEQVYSSPSVVGPFM